MQHTPEQGNSAAGSTLPRTGPFRWGLYSPQRKEAPCSMSCRLARIPTPWVGRALSAVMIALLGVANVLPCAMPGSRSHCAPESANAETTPEVSVAGAHARHSTDIHPEPGVPSAQFASPESTESAVHVGHPAGHAPEPPIVLTPCASGCELVDLRTPVTGASRPGESRPAWIAPARASVSDPLAIEHVPLI